ncbi:MAG: hypothetical protein IJ303_05800 [Clostridia bacterium]|nr:hypothetical protein [Clostridia bacterium]
MKKKKFIIASFFLTLIALTTIYTVVSAVKSYNYDMDPANGVDILEGFGAAMLIVIGGFVVFPEFSLLFLIQKPSESRLKSRPISLLMVDK